MKLSKFIFIFVLLMNLINTYNLKAQNLELKGDSILSSNFGDWDKYKQLYLKTNYNSPLYYKFILSMYDNENNLVIDTDTLEEYDSLGISDTIGVNYLFNYQIAGFYGTWGDNFINTYKIPSGNYRIVVKFYDTLNNFLGDSAEKTIEVINEYLPALLSPTDNSNLFDSTINATIFKWLPPKNNTSTIWYKFKIFQIDSSQLENLEFAFENNVVIYEEITNSNNISLNVDLNSMLDSNRWYAWSVKPYKNSLLTETFMENKGVAYPFVFSKSSRKRAEANLCCQDNDIEGFEDGTMNGWIGKSGIKIELKSLRKLIYPQGKYDWSISNNDTRNHFSIVNSPSIDPIVNIPVVPNGGGKHSLMLGSSQLLSDADKITKTITVGECNKIINLRYSFILNDGGHHKSNSAMFSVKVFRGRNNGLLDNIIEPIIEYADVFNPYYKLLGDDLAYKVWDCVIINLNKYIGETVTIEIMATDCSHQGHFGYAYIDFCGNTNPNINFNINETYCINQIDNIVADGSISNNLTNWLWTVQSSDDQGNARGGEIISNWQFGEGAESNKSLAEMIKSTGYECGKFRIKLAGNNGCSNWTEQVKLINIICPAKDLAGPDLCCPNPSCSIMLGKPSKPGNTYEWLPNNCLFVDNTIARPSFIPSLCGYIEYPVKYTLKVTDQNNCSSYDTMFIYNNPPSIQSISQDSTNGCDLFLDFYGHYYTSYEWSWFDSIELKTKKVNSKKFVFPRYLSNVVVTLKLTNACGSTSQVFTVNKRRSSNVKGMQIIMSNIIDYSSKIDKRRIFLYYEFGINEGVPNSYRNAIEYKFELLDRWGAVWVVKSGVGSFKNGEIFWDGKINGKKMPEGDYHLKLSIKSCTQKEWWSFFSYRQLECVRYGRTSWFSIRKTCQESKVVWNSLSYVPIRIEH